MGFGYYYTFYIWAPICQPLIVQTFAVWVGGKIAKFVNIFILEEQGSKRFGAKVPIGGAIIHSQSQMISPTAPLHVWNLPYALFHMQNI